ncbi:MAG: ribonuclease H family protein [Fusobacterium sp. JB021]|nr:ribonuclease H family protein [Fusobacterium sp. JB020]MDP0493157.1 ribonuclease H family protein [Fusobacterium sp. JB021]MDP0507554.1 ribonuclease H family protein [Fusobacterium sp. JB019]
MKKKFYAYFLVDSKESNIVDTWEKCKNETAGKKSRYKSFKTYKEAEMWLQSGANYDKKIKPAPPILKDGIYFDAGTGRGIGVEVRVTFKDGKSVLKKYFPTLEINEFGNYLTRSGKTNNFGELAGMYLALHIAIEEKIMNIFGDSSLVINYWSKGLIKNSVSPETQRLAKKVKLKREIFEKLGGSIEHISGDFNPADLGFHK